MTLTAEVEFFEYSMGGKRLICCVSKSDFERFGINCFSKPEITKGVSDEICEALQDYKINYALAFDLDLTPEPIAMH